MGLLLLVVKPFSLIGAAVLFVARAFGLVTSTWIQVVKSFINFQADICWKMVVWSLAFISFPARVLTAVQRERMLEMKICNMRSELENLIWENKDLEERLHVASKDRKVVEMVFTELEDDYDKALNRIEHLENELQELKEENLRLIEVQGKSIWNHRNRAEKDYDIHEGIPIGSKYAVPPWRSDYDSGNMILQDVFNPTKPVPAPVELYSLPQLPTDCSILDEAMRQRRASALSQSLFSALLSLLVGAIIWEAEDPCMPLVAALFIVVGMSLSSVVQFFSTIKNKPASDAVALLSFNWFVLGTLTSPTLPRVARVLAPPALRMASGALGWLGIS